MKFGAREIQNLSQSMHKQSTDLGCCILGKKSRVISWLTEEATDSVAPQHGPGSGQLLPKKVIEASHPLPEGNEAYGFLQRQCSLVHPLR